MTRRAGSAVLVFALAGIPPAMAHDIPATLAPPSGAVMVGAYKAIGVQIYVCTAHGSLNEPVFKAPDAQLMENDTVVAKHYAGPTWEATDGSKIVGKVLQSVPAPATGNIPWLLLAAQAAGKGRFEDVRFVQRIETSGGSTPASPCAMPGAELRVPYTATYRFFR